MAFRKPGALRLPLSDALLSRRGNAEFAHSEWPGGLRARLVVLSCCHSARGEVMAEGVVGVARAFLGAGARAVVVTLWAIADEGTLEFMSFFYDALAKGKKASEALNQAMKCLRKSETFKEVKYWAPFVLIGDDVTLDFNNI